MPGLKFHPPGPPATEAFAEEHPLEAVPLSPVGLDVPVPWNSATAERRTRPDGDRAHGPPNQGLRLGTMPGVRQDRGSPRRQARKHAPSPDFAVITTECPACQRDRAILDGNWHV